MDGIIEEMPQTTDPRTVAEPESLDQLIGRHNRERASAAARLDRERLARETEQLDALNDNIAASLAVVVDELRKRIRADRAEAQLMARVVLGKPHGVDELAKIADAAEPGEKVGLLMIPPADRFGLQERKAWLLVDVSREVWG